MTDIPTGARNFAAPGSFNYSTQGQPPPSPPIEHRDVSRPSLRDQFAMAALTGMLANGRESMADNYCDDAYRYADRMLKFREVKR